MFLRVEDRRVTFPPPRRGSVSHHPVTPPNHDLSFKSNGKDLTEKVILVKHLQLPGAKPLLQLWPVELSKSCHSSALTHSCGSKRGDSVYYSQPNSHLSYFRLQHYIELPPPPPQQLNPWEVKRVKPQSQKS